jgi:FkbM family methyltransferase
MQIGLPWNLVIDVELHESIGGTIAMNGVWDLSVTEAIFRLLDRGDVAVDVGANIGYMTGVMGVCSGRGGRVLAFEPHPYVFSILARHCARWQRLGSVGALEPRQAALGRKTGTAVLFTNEHFEENLGQGKLHGIWGDATELEVRMERLDDVVGDIDVGLMKVDVEGAELEVLEGAQMLLANRRVRDVIFEDHRRYPTPVTDLLESHGYSVGLIHRTVFRPKLVDPPRRRPGGRGSKLPGNYRSGTCSCTLPAVGLALAPRHTPRAGRYLNSARG